MKLLERPMEADRVEVDPSGEDECENDGVGPSLVNVPVMVSVRCRVATDTEADAVLL